VRASPDTQVGQGLADSGQFERDDVACAADDLDGLLDLGAVLVGELIEVGADAADEATDAGDFLIGRHGLALGPVIGAEGGQAFAAAQQVSEVGLGPHNSSTGFGSGVYEGSWMMVSAGTGPESSRSCGTTESLTADRDHSPASGARPSR
jgi:hypothetical protein